MLHSKLVSNPYTPNIYSLCVFICCSHKSVTWSQAVRICFSVTDKAGGMQMKATTVKGATIFIGSWLVLSLIADDLSIKSEPYCFFHFLLSFWKWGTVKMAEVPNTVFVKPLKTCICANISNPLLQWGKTIINCITLQIPLHLTQCFAQLNIAVSWHSYQLI